MINRIARVNRELLFDIIYLFRKLVSSGLWAKEDIYRGPATTEPRPGSYIYGPSISDAMSMINRNFAHQLSQFGNPRLSCS